MHDELYPLADFVNSTSYPTSVPRYEVQNHTISSLFSVGESKNLIYSALKRKKTLKICILAAYCHFICSVCDEPTGKYHPDIKNSGNGPVLQRLTDHERL